MAEFHVCIELDGLTMDTADSLYDKGFDDGLLHGRGNRIFIDLDIEATTFVEAALLVSRRVIRAGLDVVSIFPGDQPPPHNSKAMIEHYAMNVEQYVRSVVNAGRLFLNRRQ